MKIELKINNCEDRSALCSILCFAGYKVSIEERKNKEWSTRTDYFVIVEDKEANP